jgi:UDP-N-acetylmuramate dehydrogenase
MLDEIPGLRVRRGAPLADYTRFGIGGPADVLAETGSERAMAEALRVLRAAGASYAVIGGGTNLVVADAGFRGTVLRYTSEEITVQGGTLRANAGAVLDTVVNYAIARGLAGIETLAGIPGSLGGAVYGNAGAYGHAIAERIRTVRFFDGEKVRTIGHESCQFTYRDSIFKRRGDWIVLAAEFDLAPTAPDELSRTAADIVQTRNRKFPPTMKCAGSIFKNLLMAELAPCVAAQVPESKVREGKVAAAFFLEQAGAKGCSRGAIRVADYHANLIYNDGGGTAADLVALIADLKERVRARFGLELEEEVQYLG